jgi:hypothetical protein
VTKGKKAKGSICNLNIRTVSEVKQQQLKTENKKAGKLKIEMEKTIKLINKFMTLPVSQKRIHFTSAVPNRQQP